MKPFTRLKPCLAGSRAKGAALALTTAACALALPITAFAAKGGNGGGKPGDGGDGGDGGGNTNPPKEAPITYTQTQLHWHEDTDPDFGGLYVETVNRQGIAVGWVVRPSGFVHGVVNIDANGDATDTMIDLNDLLARVGRARLADRLWPDNQ